MRHMLQTATATELCVLTTRLQTLRTNLQQLFLTGFNQLAARSNDACLNPLTR
jgi:hypothetical protein